MHVEISFNDVAHYSYNTDEYLFNHQKFNYDDTYIAVRGPAQSSIEKIFLEKVKQGVIKLIYESKEAINIRYSRTQPRNKVYIWEMVKPDTQPVQDAKQMEKTEPVTT